MPVFEVTSRITQQVGTAKKRRTRVRKWWRTFVQFDIAAIVVGVMASVLFITNLANLFFILLPVCVYFVWQPFQLSRLLHGTWLYAILTIGLEILYFSTITGIEFFIHTPGFGLLYLYHGPPVAMIIVVTTTLAWAVMLAPLHTLAQTFIERRFNRRDYEAARAIAAFTSTLREEIDLDRVRNGLLAVVQQTMRPQASSLWVRKVPRYDLEGLATHTESDITIADDDPVLAYALSHSGAMEVERLQLESPVLHSLQTNGVELALPLASQGELIGLLTLGPRLGDEEYNRENRVLLNTLVAQAAPALRVAQLVQEQREQVREQAAQEEATRLAVMTERLRIARDLHDLLGHNLSLITLKSELARRLAGSTAERLASEIGDIEQVARTTLQEVREAVSNYRQPTISNELHGAQEILAAAGIACNYENNGGNRDNESDIETLPTAIEAVLAWAIREGVTNVIRHSHAHSCTILVTRMGENAAVEIIDDGMGSMHECSGRPADSSLAHASGHGGNGLRGLAERVVTLRGFFAAGPRDDGGFRLAVSVPLEQRIHIESSV
jgi:signal transduction histidine kinase